MAIVSSGQITITDLSDGKDGIAGKDGVGIKATAITYTISTSGTTAPSTGWTSSVPSLVKGQYLWTKTVWTYTDNSSETGYTVSYISKDGNNGTDGIAGKDGVGIQTTTITYVGSTSGTTAPTSGWASTVPTVAAGSYLWTKTVWTYTDNTIETGYSVAKTGVDGKTSYLHIAYATNSTGTAGFDVSNATGKTYIGQYTDFTSADATDPSKYTWSLIKGDKGLKGDPGNNGTNGTSGIIVSSVAPSSPQTGQLWQDTSTTPQLVKKWTGASWVIWELYVENMNVNNLSALSPNLGTITGGSYESWSSDINQESSNVNFNGIYIKNGKNRSLTIIYPENTTPDKNTFQGGLYTGTQTGNDGISYFAINSNQMDNITPHELLTELDNPYGFWERMALNNISSYAGKLFTSYKDGISHGLAFDSPNGLSVIGDLSVTGSVTTNTTSSVTVALFYGITVDFRRQGNLVIASIGRQLRTTSTPGEDVVILEKVPSGYRPPYLHYFEINRNSSSNVLTGLIMGFEPNGDVRVTIGSTETAMFSGSTSYFTTDPLP